MDPVTAMSIARGAMKVANIARRALAGAREARAILVRVQKEIEFGDELVGMETGLDSLSTALEDAIDAVESDSKGSFGEGLEDHASLAVAAISEHLNAVLGAGGSVRDASGKLRALSRVKGRKGKGAHIVEGAAVGLVGMVAGALGKEVHAALQSLASTSRRLYGDLPRAIDGKKIDPSSFSLRVSSAYNSAAQATRKLPMQLGEGAPALWRRLEKHAQIADAVAGQCVLVATDVVRRMIAQARERGRVGGGIDLELELACVRHAVLVEVAVLKQVEEELGRDVHSLRTDRHVMLLERAAKEERGAAGGGGRRGDTGVHSLRSEAARHTEEAEALELAEKARKRATRAKAIARDRAMRDWEREWRPRKTEFTPIVNALKSRNPKRQNKALDDACSRIIADDAETVLCTKGFLRTLTGAFSWGSHDMRAEVAFVIALVSSDRGEVIGRALLQFPGLVDGLVGVMESGTAEGKAQAALTVWNIANGSDATKDGLLRHAGVVGGLVSMMERGTDWGKQEAAAAVWIIARGSDATKDGLFRHAGVVEGLVGLMESGTDMGKAWATQAIRIMSESASVARQMARNSALVRILRSAGYPREDAVAALRNMGL